MLTLNGRDCGVMPLTKKHSTTTLRAGKIEFPASSRAEAVVCATVVRNDVNLELVPGTAAKTPLAEQQKNLPTQSIGKNFSV